jgi:hypothetical protein
MLHPVLPSPAGTGFGLGFVLGTTRGHVHAGHGGAVYGFSSDFAAFPEEGIGVVALNNLDGTGGVNAKLRAAVLEHLLSRGRTMPRGRSRIRTGRRRAGAADARGLDGVYRAGSAVVEVEAIHGVLVLRQAGVQSRLAHVGDDRYETDDRMSWGTTVDFERVADGRGSAVTIGDARYRLEADGSGGEGPPDTTGLLRFCGDYGPAWAGLRIGIRRGHLACRIEWFYEYDLAPVERLRFTFPGYGMFEGEELSFVEKADGGIAAVMLSGIRFERSGGGAA